MIRICVCTQRTIIQASVLIAAFFSQRAEASECYLVRKFGSVPYLYSPGYGPGCRHVVAVYDRAGDDSVLKDDKVWTYCHKNADGVKTGYQIGVARSCGCGGRCRCAGRLYLWMAVPPDRIHEGHVTYVNPECRLRSNIESVWDDFKDSEEVDHFKLDDDDYPVAAHELLSDAYVAVSPKTFRDLLTYGYGFTSPTSAHKDAGLIGAVDLAPGMRLRADFSLWNAPRAGDLPSSQAKSDKPAQNGKQPEKGGGEGSPVEEQTQPVWDGYVPVGSAYYDVVRSVQFLDGESVERVAVSPFFGILRQDFVGGTLGQNSLPSQFVHNAFALNHHADNDRLPRYWRLVYPTEYAARQISQPEPANHILLMSSYSAENLTDEKCIASRAITWNPNPTPTDNGILVYAFTGHASITPLIAATVGGSRNFVELGSTVRQQLDVVRDMTAKSTSGISLMRDFEGRSVPVRFADSDLDLYELPLFKGDRLQW